ncbi:MAG TPA: hypothetical protein VE781_01715 [Kineosporiaceae bacterium]|nr:hypothetical protein [Kineosporiaceae bacterium]
MSGQISLIGAGGAAGLLRAAGVPGRLVLADGTLLHLGGWPAPLAQAA